MSMRRGVPVLALAALLAGAGAVAARSAGVRINATVSMPRGLWLASSPGEVKRGDTVTFCVPPAEGKMAMDRGYIGPGNCPGGTEPLLKPIVGVPGDVVAVSPLGISVNGMALVNSAPLSRDADGRVVMSVPPGTYRVNEGEVWVISSHTPLSFDSRYFGPVPMSDIRGVATPLLTERDNAAH